jgi:hypothetical protein
MKILVGSVITFIVLLLVEGFFLTNEIKYSATVVDKHYQSEITHTGTGVGMTTNGSTAIVVTSSTSPEKFVLGIKLSNGDYKTLKVPSNIYYEVENGNDINFVGNRGSVTGIYYYTTKIKINDK